MRRMSLYESAAFVLEGKVPMPRARIEGCSPTLGIVVGSRFQPLALGGFAVAAAKKKGAKLNVDKAQAQ